MLLLSIHNRSFLAHLEFYLDQAGVEYTTDPEQSSDGIVIAEGKSAFQNQENKISNTIFLFALEEEPFLRALEKKNQRTKRYLEQLKKGCDRCRLILVSHAGIQACLTPYTKTPIAILPKELPSINISRFKQELYSLYKISKRKKKILIWDPHYQYAKWVQILGKKYPKYHFLYMGYEPTSHQTKKTREAIFNFSKNISLIKYDTFDLFSDLCKMSYAVFSFSSFFESPSYLDLILMFQKPLLMRKQLAYQTYLVHEENCYLFEQAEQFYALVEQLFHEKLPNLTPIAYQLVKDHYLDQIVFQYRQYFS